MTDVARPQTRPYTVPDFKADKAVKARYAADVKSHIDRAVNVALTDLRHSHHEKRTQLEGVVTLANAQLADAEAEGARATEAYATLLPHRRVRGGGVRRPSFFENLRTFGRAARMYREAAGATDRKRLASQKARTAEDDYERHQQKFDSLQATREAEIRTYYTTKDGLAEIHRDPPLHSGQVACERIDAERAAFEARQTAGLVTDAELRDRYMAQDDQRFLDGELEGVRVARDRDIRFGGLRYFAARDRLGRAWLLEYDDELRPLGRMTIDIVRNVEGDYAIRRTLIDELRTAVTDEAEHEGDDARAGAGVDLKLMGALRDFVNRETVG